MVGLEGADPVPYFFQYGINTIILRNRLGNDGYVAEVDAVHDALKDTNRGSTEGRQRSWVRNALVVSVAGVSVARPENR